MNPAAASHRRAADAVEFVLGTLSAAERAEFTRSLETDAELRDTVSYWENQLSPLAARVAPVLPPERLREVVMAALPSGSHAVRTAMFGNDGDSAEIITLRRSRAVWRSAAGVAGLLAASLAGIIVLDGLHGINAPSSSGLVAVVNRSGELPALIVRVDARAGTVQVRSLTAEAPAGRSLELWSIVGSGPPRSLGLLAGGAARVSVPASDRPRLDGATLAVTVEPQGGSPTGGPTGEIVYSGKLVPEPR